MELAGEYILGKALSLTECILHRVCQKAGEGGGTRFGTEINRSLNDVMVAVEKETTQILDCLASQQKSKVDSAYQYIKFALSDLQAWNEEPSIIAETTNRLDQLSVSNFTVSAPTTSKYFRDAIWQLRQADEWATEAFNDKRNSKPIVRVEALHIRLFCRALLDWDNKRLWFSKWRQVLEPFLADRQFVRYAMGEQSFTSRLLSDERAKPVGERLIQVTKCLEYLIWSMVLKDPSLAPYAREFALHFDKHSTLAPDVKLQSEWSGLRTFHLTYYDLTEEIELKLCADRLVIRLYEFKAIAPSASGRIWAIEQGGRLISFDANEPQTQSLVINDGRRWLSVGYASDTGKIYATSEDETQICVFHASTGEEIKNERISLPPGPTLAYAYQMKITPSGIIFLRDKGSGKGFVLFSDKSSDRKWFESSKGDYDAVLQGENPNEIIGLRQAGYFLIADVIKKIAKQGQEEIVVKTIKERIQLPQEPKAHLVAVGNQTSLSDCEITVACQTDKVNHLISLGVKVGEHGNVGFPVKDVSNFDAKYMDWKMAREMVEADGRLFILFW